MFFFHLRTSDDLDPLKIALASNVNVTVFHGRAIKNV